MGNVYKNLQHYNHTKKSKILIVFDNIIANIETNEKLSPIATELFFKGRKLNISLVFILQSYFKRLKTIRLKTQQHISDFFGIWLVSFIEVTVQYAFNLEADLKVDSWVG